MEREEVLKSAIAGDINAFQTLFAEFQNQLKSYLYRLLTDRNDVDDLTHDTFIRAFSRISTFNQDSSLKTWVFKIATNLAYDHLRKKKRWQVNGKMQPVMPLQKVGILRCNLHTVVSKQVVFVSEILKYISSDAITSNRIVDFINMRA